MTPGTVLEGETMVAQGRWDAITRKTDAEASFARAGLAAPWSVQDRGLASLFTPLPNYQYRAHSAGGPLASQSHSQA